MTQLSLAARISASIVLSVILVVGLVGNVWLIWLLLRHKNLRANIINIFIVSLCVNDLINLSLVQALVTASYMKPHILRDTFFCTLVPEFSMMLVAVSLWHHCLIAIHRYLVVVKWAFYRGINKQLYRMVVIIGSRAVPLICSFAFAIKAWTNRVEATSHLALGARVLDIFSSQIIYDNAQLRCIYKSKDKNRHFTFLILHLIVPCAIVILCFTLVFVHVRQNAARHRHRANASYNAHRFLHEQSRREPVNKEVADSEKENGNGAHKGTGPETHPMAVEAALGKDAASFDKRQLARELSITTMFGVVFLLFLVGFVPYTLSRTLIHSDDYPNFYAFLSCSYGIASCMNPLIFGLMNREIRQASQETLSRRFKRH